MDSPLEVQYTSPLKNGWLGRPIFLGKLLLCQTCQDDQFQSTDGQIMAMISMGSSQCTKARWKENFGGAIRETEQWGWNFESLKLVAFTQNASNNKSQRLLMKRTDRIASWYVEWHLTFFWLSFNPYSTGATLDWSTVFLAEVFLSNFYLYTYPEVWKNTFAP